MPELPLPDMIEIEPTDTCNLRCRMCHVSAEPQHRPTYLDPALLDSLTVLRGRDVTIAATYEPMVHPRFVELIQRLSALDFRMELITNGTQLKGDAAKVLEDSNLLLMTFSFDGIDATTYEHIRRGASWASTVANIADFRSKCAHRDTYFVVNSTLMRRNLDETEAVVDFWNDLEFDHVGFIPMVLRELTPELITESVYPIRQRALQVMDAAARRVIQNRLRIAMGSLFLRYAAVAVDSPTNVEEG